MSGNILIQAAHLVVARSASHLNWTTIAAAPQTKPLLESGSWHSQTEGNTYSVVQMKSVFSHMRSVFRTFVTLPTVESTTLLIASNVICLGKVR